MANDDALTTQREVVPLPAELAECGHCPNAQVGMHLTSCRRARDFDAIRLTDRPEYEPGRQFRAIRWQYPLTITTHVDVTVEIDPVAFILAHREEYEQFALGSEFAEWEKPINFLCSRVEQEAEPFGSLGPRGVAEMRTFIDDFNEQPRWTPEMTEALNEALAGIPDPNQGVLPIGVGD